MGEKLDKRQEIKFLPSIDNVLEIECAYQIFQYIRNLPQASLLGPLVTNRICEKLVLAHDASEVRQTLQTEAERLDKREPFLVQAYQVLSDKEFQTNLSLSVPHILSAISPDELAVRLKDICLRKEVNQSSQIAQRPLGFFEKMDSYLN
jgi:hypothetical protein